MKSYLQHYPYHHPARAVIQRAAAYIRRHAQAHFHGRLLDIGCGSKWKEGLVGDLVAEYIGLDHESSIHDHSVVDIVGTAYEIPEPDDSYDCVLCTSVLEHLEEPGSALRESLRVLKPGGIALYSMPLFWHLHEQPRDFYRYTPFGLDYLFRRAGFEIVALEPMSGFWLTFAAELNYYWLGVAPRLLRPLVRVAVALNNVVAPAFDALERRINPRSREWAWQHVVVARKPRG